MAQASTGAWPEYEVYALRYARMPRRRADNFLGGDPHDGPMPMDFFVWLVRGAGRCVLVDTGFNAATAARRRRDLLGCPIAGLARLGVAPEQVQDVVLTHLHYDHAGNLAKLADARLHVQDAELDYATGRCMCHAPLRHAYEVEDVVTLVRRVYQDRVVFHDGDAVLHPGIELLKIGGHTKGLQAVRVHTRRGWVVLASDASHYYENMQAGRFRSCSMWRTCCPATSASSRPPAVPRTWCRDTIRRCWRATRPTGATPTSPCCTNRRHRRTRPEARCAAYFPARAYSMYSRCARCASGPYGRARCSTRLTWTTLP